MTNPEDYLIDGIEQEDAPIPVWWKRSSLFLLMCCPLYLLYFHAGASGRSAVDQYESKIQAITKKKYAEIGDLQPDAATILKFVEKDNWVKVGKVIFKSKCATCHGREAEGKIGPNLTDEHYKNVRKVEDIARVISNGANNNAMPAWNDKLLQNDIVLVSAYVASIRGTNADNGKGPEGMIIAEWEASPPSEPESDEPSSNQNEPQ